MSDEANGPNPRIIAVVASLLSATIIACMYGVMYFRARYIPAPPFWYAIAMMVPHLTVGALYMTEGPSDFAAGLAKGVAIGTAVGAFGAAVIFAVGTILSLAFWLPPVTTLAATAGEILTLLGPGLGLLFPLLVLQIFLVYGARYRSKEPKPASRTGGMICGLATVLIPLSLGLHDTTIDKGAAVGERLFEESQKYAAEAPKREALARRQRIVKDALLTGVPLCLRRGCIDSLLTALRSAGYTVVFKREPASHYWVAATDEGWSDSYFTDETGTVLSWPVGARNLPSAAPYSGQMMRVVDSAGWDAARDMKCLSAMFESRKMAGPTRIIQPHSCGLASDTTTRKFGDSAPYHVVYLSRENGFSLSARPVTYGDGAVRSFLFNSDGRSYVTLEDRGATVSDLRVYPCELIYAFCEYEKRNFDR